MAIVSRRRSSGLTLIELMISMVLGLLIVGGMASMYAATSRTNAEMAKTNGLIENGQFAINVLAEDLTLAGYWAGHVPQFDDLMATTAPADVPTAAPDPCLAFTTANWTAGYKNNLVGLPAQVFGDVPTGCTSIVTNKLANTDVVVVRHASSCVPGEPNCEADNASKVYFQSSLCATEIAANNRYVFNNTGLNLHVRNCTTPASKRKFISNIYYIRNYATTAGDGVPTLMRSNFDLVASTPEHTAAVALVEGIQGFTVEFGLDSVSRCAPSAVNYASAPVKVDAATCTVNTAQPEFNTTPNNRGDGVPELPFVHCTGAGGCTAAQLTNVVAAKIFVLARSKEAAAGYTDTKTYQLGATTLGPFNDGFKRHVYQLTVRLNNVASRRETP